MDQRTTLRIVYWLIVGALMLAAVQPFGSYGYAKPGIFVRYADNWAVLVLGVAVFMVLVWIGLRI